MSKMRFMLLEIDGDEQSVAAAMRLLSDCLPPAGRLEADSPAEPAPPELGCGPSAPAPALPPSPPAEVPGRPPAAGNDPAGPVEMSTMSFTGDVAPIRNPQSELRNKKERRVICLERPGEELSIEQAIKLAGTNRKRLSVVLSPSNWRTGGSIHGVHLADAKRGPCPTWPKPATDIGEARPRHNGEATAINPHVVGAGARLPQPAEKPARASDESGY